MGREVRRVPVDFDWPLRKTWQGFMMPKHLIPKDCDACDHSGYNPETKKLYDEWYDHEGFVYVTQLSSFYADEDLLNFVHSQGGRWCYRYGQDPTGQPAEHPPWKIIGECRSWCHNITQDEVQALVDENRLYDFTHIHTNEGWKPREDIPTAAEVNEWSQHGFGHDALNCSVCVKARATRLGVYGKCTICDGKGYVWDSPEQEIEYEEWVGTPPPKGPAYQIWETVSEGSPVSPPFINPEDLARWMVENDTSVTKDTTYDQWLKFIKDVQWAPSMVGWSGHLKSGVQALVEMKERP